MAVGRASRFSVLKLEDDDFDDVPSPSEKKTEKKTPDKSANNKKKQKKKNKDEDLAAQLKNLAFGPPGPRLKPQNTGGRKKTEKAQKEQWDEWIKKDSEFVSDSYEQDLQEAILQSKIAFEEKEKVSDDVHEANGEQNKSKNKKTNKKKEKQTTTMSLEEFNKLDGGGDNTTVREKSERGTKNDISHSRNHTNSSSAEDNERFFDKIAEDTNKMIQNEQHKEAVKKRTKAIGGEGAIVMQYQEEIETRDKQIDELSAEVTKLKENLLAVKIRNKKLCNILAQAEIREKVDVVLQVESLTAFKEELTEQVTALHTALEQERSKVHQLQTELKKAQVHKKV